MKFCTHCGKEIKEEAKFCVHCGNTQEVSQTAAPVEKVAEKVEPSNVEPIRPAVNQDAPGNQNAHQSATPVAKTPNFFETYFRFLTNSIKNPGFNQKEKNPYFGLVTFGLIAALLSIIQIRAILNMFSSMFGSLSSMELSNSYPPSDVTGSAFFKFFLMNALILAVILLVNFLVVTKIFGQKINVLDFLTSFAGTANVALVLSAVFTLLSFVITGEGTMFIFYGMILVYLVVFISGYIMLTQTTIVSPTPKNRFYTIFLSSVCIQILIYFIFKTIISSVI